MKALRSFRIFSTNDRSSIKMNIEVPLKSRRKKKNVVPVHKNQKPSENVEETPPRLRTYNGQFYSKKKMKPRNDDVKSTEVDYFSEHNWIADRNALAQTNASLVIENRELTEKLIKSDEYFNARIIKLKTKLNSFRQFNEEIVNENNLNKAKIQDLQMNIELCRNKFETIENCKNCEELNKLIDKFYSDNNFLINSNKQLFEDLNMLKNVVYRLNVQLERYQEKLRKYNIQRNESNVEVPMKEYVVPLSGNHAEYPHAPICWGTVNSHTLGPLLNAYQGAFEEKESLIQDYETELSCFMGKLNEITKENETLHQHLTVDDKCSAKLRVEVDRISKELLTTKEQNDLLIQKCSLKQVKLEEVLQCYEEKVEQLKRDYNVVVEQYHKSRIEISALKDKNKSLASAHDEFKNEKHNYVPVSVHTASVTECKQWYEELKRQYEREETKMKETIIFLQNQVNDITKHTEKLKLEKDEVENKMKLGEKQTKKSQEKYLNIQKTLQEEQLSRMACRKQLHKAMEFAKDLVTEQEKLLKTLHQRHQENKAVMQIGTDIAVRMDSLKSQLKSVQRDAWQELSTVEQRLQNQDTIIVTLQKEHNDEVHRLQTIIKHREEHNFLLEDDGNIVKANKLK